MLGMVRDIQKVNFKKFYVCLKLGVFKKKGVNPLVGHEIDCV